MLAVCPECGGTFAGTDRFCQRDGARLLQADENDPLLGQTVGSYRIAALLGAGGMGRVYLAVHPTIGSRVAIKVLSRDLTGRRELVERFFAEAQLVNRIRHEGIVNVLDLSSLPDGRPYIVMELLAGESLAALLSRSGRLDPGQAVGISCALLDALAAAHECGVVHRDLKPDNVFVTRQGRVVVLDFGIAKLLPERAEGVERMSPTTKTGAVLGTPGYMAPEQIQGKPASPATDLYSAGVILYQMLSGRLPFEGESLFDLMQKHVSAIPVPLRESRPDLPPALDGAILRAMSKEPAMRFANARHMAESLVAALSAPPVPARAPDPPVKVRRGSMLAGVALVAALAAAIVAVALLPEDEPIAPIAAASSADAAVVAVIDAAAASDAAVASAPAADAGVEVAAGPTETTAPRRRQKDRPEAPPEKVEKKIDEEPAKEESAEAKAASDSKAGETTVGGVTIINTAEKARAMTGLKTIVARPESKGGSFDPMRTLVQAQGMARKLMPDAVLVGIDIDHARPDGSALLRSDSGATYRFRSPARSKRPADVPRNVEVDIPCMIHVTVERDQIAASPVTHEECDARRLATPRCSVADLWRRARDEGAPKTNDWVARISYSHDGWFIDIPKAGKPPFDDFTLSLSDNCQSRGRTAGD